MILVPVLCRTEERYGLLDAKTRAIHDKGREDLGLAPGDRPYTQHRGPDSWGAHLTDREVELTDMYYARAQAAREPNRRVLFVVLLSLILSSFLLLSLQLTLTMSSHVLML